ncbi:hypothetical protein [Myroides guanonis]|uniref:Lipoprotein n=1 Tax=Myroides guanonis TaxID=1150112 RepID=A0A1I3UWG8_9FLAO|nr:hypothetical protein [Myroides guanonis]SFJ87415.1 hypothetical protein SAMN04487893_12030 [Myroides guanonis]
MKKNVLFLSLLSFLLFGCISSDSKVTNTKQKSDIVVTEEVLNNNLKDTVANTQNDNTIKLISVILDEMFKDDLSKKLIEESSRKFKFFEYDLNDDRKKEIFVGLMGPYFCGSGGCTLLLLSSEGKLMTKFTVTQSPISITNIKSEGWKDLVLHSNGRDYLIRFNGDSYPSNPSVQPLYTSTAEQNLINGLHLADQSYSW